MIVTRSANEVYELDLASGRKGRSWRLPAGLLDGCDVLPDGRVLASSWESSCLYAVTPATGVV